MISPEQGAQQEWSKTLFSPLGDSIILVRFVSGMPVFYTITLKKQLMLRRLFKEGQFIRKLSQCH